MERNLEEDARAWARMFKKRAGSSEDVETWLRETLPRIGWPHVPHDTARQLLWRFWRERWRDDRTKGEAKLRRMERDPRARERAGIGPRSIWDILREPEKTVDRER